MFLRVVLCTIFQSSCDLALTPVPYIYLDSTNITNNAVITFSPEAKCQKVP